MQISEKQRKELADISQAVAQQALKLRNLHHEDDASPNHPLWEASQLLHSAQLKLQGFLQPETAPPGE
jgi:hypothetical protein